MLFHEGSMDARHACEDSQHRLVESKLFFYFMFAMIGQRLMMCVCVHIHLMLNIGSAMARQRLPYRVVFAFNSRSYVCLVR